MSTPLSTPIRQAKLGIASTKSLPLANEYKKLLGEQYQRLWLKHQQDLDLIDDIRSYVKSRLSIEREYTQALGKLSKQHISHINKRFTLLQQCDQSASPGETSAAAASSGAGGSADPATMRAQNQDQRAAQMLSESEASDSRLQKRLANNGLDEPDKACTLYKVWSEHINRLQSSSKNRADQFEQLTMVVDKLKDIRSHKATIGKKCLDSHLRRIHEDILVSMVDVEKARKLYHEDESQAKKARENEEKIKKKRSGLLTKFTGGDLQAKKEKTSAQREANDIQSTQARNDYIMALAAANAHLQHYYLKDLSDFMSLIDDGVLDHCKIFMATLSECDINSLKDALHHAQYWSKMINLTGSQKTNAIFLDCDQSNCLRKQASLVYEPCNSDPISSISLEHNADYALQHEIDKWFTWFKKECRNLSQLIHQLERCQRALAEGQKSIELNGQTVEDLEPRIIELKQQIRKSEAAKHKAQARLRVIKEGGMQIEEWSVVESEIRADMARAQQELDARRLCEVSARRNTSSDEEDEDGDDDDGLGREASTRRNQNNNNSSNLASANHQVLLQISKDSDGSEIDESIHNLASVSRSTSNLMDKQQKAISGYSALTDPSLVWQDDYSNAWNTAAGAPSASSAAVVSSSTAPMDIKTNQATEEQHQQRYNHLETSSALPASAANGNANTVQSSSPLSAIMDGNHGLSTSPYQPMGEAYKSDYECDYNRTSGGPHMMNSAASSAEPYARQYGGEARAGTEAICEQEDETTIFATAGTDEGTQQQQLEEMLGQQVIALYTFDKTNEDDLSFVEGDILRVLEINDSNWLQAKNEATGEQGFIPAPYVRLLSAEERQQEQADAGADFKYESYVEDSMNDGLEDEFAEAGNDKGREIFDEEGERQKFAVEETVSRDEKPLYCRALYDYQPEADTYESDGLPHLALVQGELYRVLDQGEEDGWWLVEKDDGSATRGHVPSMLVEELEEGRETELGDEGDDDEEEADSREVSESSNYPEFGQPPPLTALPNIEPPKLEDEDQATESLEDSSRQSATNQQQPPPSAQTTSQSAPKTTDRGDASGQTAVSASLVPTSFIIIEPTPEVESRSIGENSKSAEATANDDGEQQQEQAPKGYSVVNEDFVLEGPSRKPSQLNDTHHEPLSGCDDSEIPAPPSVVIESFEVEKHYSSDDDDQPASQDESQNHNTPKEIKHTGNVDVNPMLRLRAEEFTKQIIAEALEMTQNATSTTRGEINNHEIRDYRYGVYNGRDLDHEEDEEDEEEEVNQ